MSNAFFDRVPLKQNPLLNEHISRVDIEADMMRAFTTGYRLHELKGNTDDLKKITQALGSFNPEWGRWAGAGFTYAHAGYERNEATLD